MKMTDEPIAPVSGKESAYKLEASVSYGLSAEDIPNLSVLSIESRFLSPKQSPKHSTKKCKANLMTLQTLNDVFSPLKTDSLQNKLNRARSPKAAKASNIVSDVQSIVEKTYSDVLSIRQQAFVTLATKISQEDLVKLAIDPNVVA